jgi:hypothetical protein
MSPRTIRPGERLENIFQGDQDVVQDGVAPLPFGIGHGGDRHGEGVVGADLPLIGPVDLFRRFSRLPLLDRGFNGTRAGCGGDAGGSGGSETAESEPEAGVSAELGEDGGRDGGGSWVDFCRHLDWKIALGALNSRACFRLVGGDVPSAPGTNKIDSHAQY